MVGSEALVARASELIRGGRDSDLDVNDIDINTLIAAAVDGDPLACRVIEEAGGLVGRAVASVVNLMNPSTVVVGGGLTRAGSAFMDSLRKTVQSSTLWLALDGANIVTSQLGEREIAIGAATLMLESALDDPSLLAERLAVANSA
jgi:predicted NBD/HSP70 family sugar kinase